MKLDHLFPTDDEHHSQIGLFTAVSSLLLTILVFRILTTSGFQYPYVSDEIPVPLMALAICFSLLAPILSGVAIKFALSEPVDWIGRIAMFIAILCLLAAPYIIFSLFTMDRFK